MANNCGKILSVFCLFLLLGLSTTNTAAALTFKTSNNGETQQVKKSAPKSLLADLVTRKRNAVDLSDEELCTSLTALDTVPTYYEMKKEAWSACRLIKFNPDGGHRKRKGLFDILGHTPKNTVSKSPILM